MDTNTSILRALSGLVLILSAISVGVEPVMASDSYRPTRTPEEAARTSRATATLRSDASKEAKLAAIGDLVAMGRKGSGALFAFFAKKDRDPEWDLVAAQSLSVAVMSGYQPLLVGKAAYSTVPQARLVALRGLKRYVTVPPAWLTASDGTRRWTVEYPGKPETGVALLDTDWMPEDRKWIRMAADICLQDEKATPEIKRAAQDLLDAIKDREQKEKEFLAKQTAPPDAQPAK